MQKGGFLLLIPELKIRFFTIIIVGFVLTYFIEKYSPRIKFLFDYLPELKDGSYYDHYKKALVYIIIFVLAYLLGSIQLPGFC